jgi:hypothetical protein
MNKGSTFNWKLWLQWVLATTLGWLVGISFLPLELAAGVSMGFAQWLVLRPIYPKTGWWMPLSAGGWMLGWGISMALGIQQTDFLVAGLVGLSLGLFQWIILNQWVPISQWWIVVNILAWVIGLSGFTDPRFAGLVVGIVTGIALELLSRYSKKGKSNP